MRVTPGRILVAAAVLVLVALLAALSPVITYLTADPRITRNCRDELAALMPQAPEGGRALPVYASAIESLGEPPSDALWRAIHEGGLAPGHPAWEEARRYVTEREAALARIREGAGRPVLGAPLAVTVPPDVERAMLARSGGTPSAPAAEPQNPPLGQILLSMLGSTREFARLLAVDARVAAADGDAGRVAADIVAMCGVARHAAEAPIFIAGLTGCRIADTALATLGDLLEQDPNLLDAGQLAEVQRALAALDLPLHLLGERLMMEDALQRLYSDDGRGDGKLTHAGIVACATPQDGSDPYQFRLPDGRIERMLEILRLAYTEPSRRTVHDEAAALLDFAESQAALPPWEADLAELDRRTADVWVRVPSRVLAGVTGPTARGIQSTNVSRARRDGAVAALAARRYRLETGEWPRTLGDLVPAYLPGVPRDMFTGRPLCYRPGGAGAEPRLYSVGADRDDDGGVVPAGVAGKPGSPFDPGADGDWLFLGASAGNPAGTGGGGPSR